MAEIHFEGEGKARVFETAIREIPPNWHVRIQTAEGTFEGNIIAFDASDGLTLAIVDRDFERTGDERTFAVSELVEVWVW